MTHDWKREYWNFMMLENYEAGFALKDANFPRRFFKYRKLNSRTINNILERKIWMADISSLNDPFECSLQFDHDKCSRVFFASKKFHATFTEKFRKVLTQTEINSIVKSKNPFAEYHAICEQKGIIINTSPENEREKMENRFAEMIEETNQNIRVCSFSEINDSLLLWSHYSDEHKGICIEYDLLDEVSEIRAFLQPILYSDKIHKIGLFEELTSLNKIGSTLIKCKDWEYEREWRVTILKQPDNFPEKMTISKPKAIYLGTRFHLNDNTLKQELFDVINALNIPKFQMIKHPNEYKLIAK